MRAGGVGCITYVINRIITWRAAGRRYHILGKFPERPADDSGDNTTSGEPHPAPRGLLLMEQTCGTKKRKQLKALGLFRMS